MQCHVTSHLQLLLKGAAWPLPNPPCASATWARPSMCWFSKATSKELTLVFFLSYQWAKNFISGLCKQPRAQVRSWTHGEGCVGGDEEQPLLWQPVSITHKLKERPIIKELAQDNYCNSWLLKPISLPPSDRDSNQGRTGGFEGICLWKFPGSKNLHWYHRI